MIEITEKRIKEIIEQAHMAGQSEANGCAPSYSQASTYYNREVKKLIIPDVMPRYFVDERAGCAAVRDREHCKYDPTYQGLHHNTSDVIEYKHGSVEGGRWIVDQDDLKHLHELCAKLNGA